MIPSYRPKKNIMDPPRKYCLNAIFHKNKTTEKFVKANRTVSDDMVFAILEMGSLPESTSVIRGEAKIFMAYKMAS